METQTEYWTITVMGLLDTNRGLPSETYVSTEARLVRESESAHLANYALAEELLEVSHGVFMKQFAHGYSATLACRQVRVGSDAVLNRIKRDSYLARVFISNVHKQYSQRLSGAKQREKSLPDSQQMH
jgi:hypothetical protein